MSIQRHPYSTAAILNRLASVFFFTMVYLVTSVAQAQTGGVSQTQYKALVAFYNATGGSSWVTNEGWLTSAPVETWYGVTVENGNVTALNLSFNNLTGTVPAQTANLPLTNLALDNNQITAIAAVPATLVYLDFSNNLVKKTPKLPATLQTLLASNNQLNCITALPASLQVINISFNKVFSLPALPASLSSLAAGNNLLYKLPALPAGLSNLEVNNNLLIQLPALSASLSTLVANNNFLLSLPAFPAELTFADVSFNLLKALPTLPANLSFFINAANNRLTFEDLEPIIGVLRAPRQYAPQAAVGPVSTCTVNEGSNLTLSANFAGNTPNTRYVWFKDSVQVSDTLTSPNYIIVKATLADSGIYTTKIFNTVVKGLILDRRGITVKVKAKASSARFASEIGVKGDVFTLSAFPNPFVSSIKVAYANAKSETVTVKISDMQGNIVFSSPAYTAGQTIDLSQLPRGQYVVQATNGTQSKTFKLVK